MIELDFLHVLFVILSLVASWVSLNSCFPHRWPPFRGRRWFIIAFLLAWWGIELGLHLSCFLTLLSFLVVHLDGVAFGEEPLLFKIALLLSLSCSLLLACLYLRGYGTLSSVASQLSLQLSPQRVSAFFERHSSFRWRHLLLPFRWARHYRHAVACATSLHYGPTPTHQFDLYYPIGQSLRNHAPPFNTKTNLPEQSPFDLLYLEQWKIPIQSSSSTILPPSHHQHDHHDHLHHLRPILISIHGGAWQFGSRSNSALPLMYKMASLGWLCFNIDYRLSGNPSSGSAVWPDHLHDCLQALRFVVAHARSLGGDPGCVVVTGGSAGGHIAALLALHAAAKPLIKACVPFYGVYDLLAEGTRSLFQRRVLFSADEGLLRDASPLQIVERMGKKEEEEEEEGMPDFLLVQGASDSLTPLAGHEAFVEALRRKGVRADALVVEGAQHAFDSFGSLRCASAIIGTACWLEMLHEDYLASKENKQKQ